MIGALRNRVDLLTPSRLPDNGGGARVDWLAGPALWAQVDRLSSTRDFSGDRERRLRRIAATVRYRNDIALGDRLRFDGAVYDIVSIEDGADDRRLVLVCEETVS